MNILFDLLYFCILDFLFFGFTAKLCGRGCNYNCEHCRNWACTHGVSPKPKSFYPVRDWSWWCNLKNK